MNSLKQKLAQKIKKAADQRKRQLLEQQKQQKNLYPEQLLQRMQDSQNSNNLNEVQMQPQVKNDSIQRNQGEKIQTQQSKIPSHTLQVFSFKQQQMMKTPFIVQTQSIKQNEEEIEKQIQIMIKQKQNRKKQDQQQKKKQMILNSIKNKRRPRPPKPMDKPTPFNQLSPPYQQIKIFAAYLPIYQQRRRRQLYSTIVDLGVKNLQQVILQCFLQGLINKNFMKSIKERGVQKQIQFVRKFAQNKLDEYDFQATKFTPLDHRALCSLLLKHNKKYILGERIYCVFKQITDFYQVIYAMQEHDYQKLCETIRIKYKLTWQNSAFKNLQQFSQQALVKFDTSSIFQLRPSPMFGADLNDDEKQFFKAKKAKYPDKVKPSTKKQFKSKNKQSQFQSKSSDFSDSFSGSLDQSQIQRQILGESQIASSSGIGTTQLKSNIKNLRGQGQSSINSGTNLRNSSSFVSEISGSSDKYGQYQDQQISESDSDSMYKSKVKYTVLNKNNPKNQPKKKGNEKKNKRQPSKSDLEQMQRDIFEQYSS